MSDTEERRAFLRYRVAEVATRARGDEDEAARVRAAAAAVVQPMRPCSVCRGLGVAAKADVDRWQRQADLSRERVRQKLMDVALRVNVPVTALA